MTAASTQLNDPLRALRTALAGDPGRPLTDERGALVRELEACLCDRTALSAYLRHLRSAGRSAGKDAADDEFLLADVLARRLDALSDADLVRLALDPATLLALHDTLLEEMPAAWLHLLLPEEPTVEVYSPQPAGTGAEAQMAVAFGHGGAAADRRVWTTDTTVGPVRVNVEYTLTAVERELSVRLFGDLRLADATGCDGTLTDAAGATITAAAADRWLRFTLPESIQWPLTFDCRYRLAGGEIRFQTTCYAPPG